MANDDSMEVQDAGRLVLFFLTQGDLFVLTLYRVLFVKELAGDPCSVRAMNKVGHKFEDRNGSLSLIDGRLKFLASGDLFKKSVYRLTRNHHSDAMSKVGEKNDDSGSIHSESSVGDEANAPCCSPVVQLPP